MTEPKIVSDPAAILRAGLAETDERARRAALAWAVRALIEGTGLNGIEAGQVLALLGYRDESLEALFRGAWLQEKIARDMGIFKRGTLKQIWSSQAAIWADRSGQPAYGYDEFRAAYSAWKKRTGGGIGRTPTRGSSKKSLGK